MKYGQLAAEVHRHHGIWLHVQGRNGAAAAVLYAWLRLGRTWQCGTCFTKTAKCKDNEDVSHRARRSLTAYVNKAWSAEACKETQVQQSAHHSRRPAGSPRTSADITAYMHLNAEGAEPNMPFNKPGDQRVRFDGTGQQLQAVLRASGSCIATQRTHHNITHTLHSLSDSFTIPSVLANPSGKKRAFINGIGQQPETVLDARMGGQHGAAARNGRGPVAPQPKELERHD